MNSPGFVAAQHFESVLSKDGEPLPYSHIAIYEVEGGPMKARETLAATSGKRVPVPDAMDADRESWWHTSISDRVVSAGSS